MVQATLTSKGQLTLPAEIRRALDVETGDRVEFTPTKGGFLLTAAPDRSVRRLAGMLGPHAGPAVSMEAMGHAIVDAATERNNRSRP
jgi:AbrB family looped-hinge helix DNA binding protein